MAEEQPLVEPSRNSFGMKPILMAVLIGVPFALMGRRSVRAWHLNLRERLPSREVPIPKISWESKSRMAQKEKLNNPRPHDQWAAVSVLKNESKKENENKTMNESKTINENANANANTNENKNETETKTDDSIPGNFDPYDGVLFKKWFAPFADILTEKEARLILGLQEDGAFGSRELNDRFRTTFSAFHPDKGGSPFLSIKIAEAKKLLEPFALDMSSSSNPERVVVKPLAKAKRYRFVTRKYENLRKYQK